MYDKGQRSIMVQCRSGIIPFKALKQADICIFQTSLCCASSVKKIVWKMKNTFYFTVLFYFYSHLRDKTDSESYKFPN